ncbi:MAG TPA: ribosome-associated translation inhibitor RaiA [Gaiellaceae bacterium]|nr:ribosome-associated translation inhibitor RaiA [Gaiellaceae bacterium]
MRLQVKGKNVEVSESVREYAEKRMGKLEKQLADPTQVELELAIERNPAIADNHVAEATIWTKGPTLRAREAATGWEASIDQLVDKLERQVVRYREKRNRHHKGGNHGRVRAEAPTGEEGLPEPRLVKTKRFAMKPMTAEEASLQLELVGHDFFVFENAASGETNVVYRRRDGDYGVIEPEA